MVAPIVVVGLAALFAWGCSDSEDDLPENDEVRGTPYQAPKVYNPTSPKKVSEHRCITAPALSNPLLNAETINGLCVKPSENRSGEILQELSRISSTAPQVPVLLAGLEDISISGETDGDLGHFAEIDKGVFATPYYNATNDELEDTIGILVYDTNDDTFSLTPIEAIDVSGRQFFDQEGLELTKILPKAQSMSKNRWTYNPITRSMYIAAANFETEEVASTDPGSPFPTEFVDTEEAALVVKVNIDEGNTPRFDDVAVLDVGITSKRVFQLGEDGRYVVTLTGDLTLRSSSQLYSDGSERETWLAKPGTGLHFNILNADTLDHFNTSIVEGANAIYVRGQSYEIYSLFSHSIKERVFVPSNDGSKLVVVGGGEENQDGNYCVHTLDPFSEKMFLGSKCLFIPASADFRTAYTGNIPEGAVHERLYASDAAFTDDGRLYVLDGDFGVVVGLEEDGDGAYTSVSSLDTVIDPACGDSIENGTYHAGYCDVFEVMRSFGLDISPDADPFYIRKAQDMVTLGNTLYIGTPGGIYKIEK